MREIILTNAQIVSRHEVFRGTVHVQCGRIASVDRGASSVPAAEDLGGDYVLPGLVEIHTDMLERHLLPRSNTPWPPLAALMAHDAQIAGVGITTVLDALCLGLAVDWDGRPRDFRSESVEALRAGVEGGWLRAQHFLHLRCELPGPNLVEEFQGLRDEPLLRLVSLMDHTPGQRQSTDVTRIRRIAQMRGFLSDEEWEARLRDEQERQQKFAAPNRLRILELTGDRDTPVASHDDTFVEHVDEAHASGIRISEFPTTLEAARAARKYGMTTVMGAPNVVLGASQSGNVSARDAVRERVLDCLSSDYAPVSLLHAVFVLADELGIPLHDAVALATANPASMVGFADRGAIERGLSADLVQVQRAGVVPRAVRVWREGLRVA
jgi:alpha-D-ribose 1-methylphosphonate 5-triphosphate diphosphatase